MIPRSLRRPGGFHGVTATSSKYPLGGHAPRSILVANEQEFLNPIHESPRRKSIVLCRAFRPDPLTERCLLKVVRLLPEADSRHPLHRDDLTTRLIIGHVFI